MLPFHFSWDQRGEEEKKKRVTSTCICPQVFFISDLKKKKKRNSQFLNTSPIYSCTPAQIDDNSLSFLFLYVFFFALSYNYSATYTHQPKDKTLRSANQPSNYPHSPPPLLLRFPPPNPPPIQPLSVPIGNKVNTYASQQPLKTTDACRDAPAVYVSLSPPPPPPPPLSV